MQVWAPPTSFTKSGAFGLHDAARAVQRATVEPDWALHPWGAARGKEVGVDTLEDVALCIAVNADVHCLTQSSVKVGFGGARPRWNRPLPTTRDFAALDSFVCLTKAAARVSATRGSTSWSVAATTKNN